jgi:hypothetical protein
MVEEENASAFPCELESNQGFRFFEQGMTLRDYFASSAMQGLIIKYGTMCLDIKIKESFEVADAMLKQRKL